MPTLTEEQKARLLTGVGYDPSQWDIDGDTFQPIPRINTQPVISTTPLSPLSNEFQRPSNPDRPLTTFAKSAAESAIPSAFAGLGAAGVAALLAPETGGLSLLSLPFIAGGGALAGGLARKAQSYIEPESWQQNVAASQQANPIAGVLGNISTMPLAGLNPSPSQVIKAGAGLGKLATGLSRTPQEAQALLNVGLGAGIGAGMPVAEDLLSGREINPKDVLLNAGLGGLFNTPNAIGRRLGFTPHEIPKILPDAIDVGAISVTPQPTIEQPLQTLPRMVPSNKEAFRYKDIAQNKYSGDIGQQPAGTTGAARELVNPSEDALSTFAGEGGLDPEVIQQRDEAIKQNQKVEQLHNQLNELRQEANKQQMFKQYEQLKANNVRIAELESKIKEIPKVQEPPFEGGMSPEAETPIGSTKYSEEPALKEQPQTELQQEIQDKLTAKGISAKPTEAWTKMLQDFGAIHRGAEVQEDGSIINKRTGKAVAGSATFDTALRKWIVKLNPEKMSLDTAPHELAGHVFLDALRAKDPAFVSKFESLVSEHPDFNKVNKYRLKNKLEPWTPEEFIATHQGLEFVRRQLNLSGETPFKTYWKDLWSNVKSKFGAGKEEDFRRILQYRFQNDPAYHDYVKSGVKISQPVKFQDESSIKNVEDARNMLRKKHDELLHANELKSETSGLTAADKENERVSRAKFNELSGADEPKENVLNSEEPALKDKSSFLPFLTSRIDKIAEKINLPEGKMVTDALHKFAGESDIQSGRIGNKLVAATRGYDEQSIQKVYRYLHQVDDKGDSNITLSPREQALSNNIVEILRQPRREQIAMGLKVREGSDTFRAAGIKPEGYMFNMIDPKVAYEWAERPLSAQSKSYDAAYIEHQIKHGVSEADAKEALGEYKKALGSNIQSDIEFGALRKAEGNGLPWDLVEHNFNNAAVRYGRRAGRDLAFFKYLQNDPKIRKALNLSDQFGNAPKAEDEPTITNIGPSKEVQDAMRSVYNIDMVRHPTILAAARALNNTVMGVGTAARNILQMPAQIASYVQLPQLPLVAKAISHLNESRVRAFENNAVKTSFADFDAAGYYEGSPNPAIRLLNRYSDFARKYQGRNFSDKFEGEYYYSLGELLATDNIARAKTGNKESIGFLKRFGDVVDGGPERLLKPDSKITQDDISRIAKRFVDASRGSYGAEGLPSWAIEGEFAPFTSLSRWSIEKSNTIWKDVIQPARKGIYGPLLRYVLGSAGVGFMVEELNKELSNKRGPEPTVNEILASGNQEALVAKAISTLQMASFAGIIGDGAQLVSSAARNKGVKYNQPLSFPLYSWMTDTMAGNISGAVQAIKEGEDPFDTLAKFVTAVSTQSVQSMRYLDANFIHPEDAKRKEKFRDYNIWQELTGRKEPDSSATDIASSYTNLGAKKFKQEEDVQKAGKELQPLIANAIEKSKDANGNIDPEKLKAEFAKIKQNNYQTIPDPERNPIAFYHYRNYLIETKGEKEANAIIADYFQHKYVNQVKSQMIPRV